MASQVWMGIPNELRALKAITRIVRRLSPASQHWLASWLEDEVNAPHKPAAGSVGAGEDGTVTP